MKNEFSKYNLSEDVLKSLELLGFSSPTKVQEEAIPVIMSGRDVLIKSQTGSGKTASFGIPLCELIDWDNNLPQVLVLTPTRELALQVREDIFNIGRFKRVKVAAVYGKESIARQEKQIKEKTHMVVGTPGRVLDLFNRRSLDLSNVKYLVIDEADQMFNMGFINQVEDIIKELPSDVAHILLSATIPPSIKSLISRHMKKPVEIEINEESKALDRIVQKKYFVPESDKMKLLENIIVVENADSCLIFANTQSKVDLIESSLNKLNIPANKIHGGMEQVDRMSVMKAFKLGKFRYLIATDVAARGIDVDSISLIINYDIPQEKESYVHRIGRTGRIFKDGKAITFVCGYEKRYLENIEEFIGKEIPLGLVPTKEEVKNKSLSFANKMSTKAELKIEKGHHINKDIVKLHINAGKKTKLRVLDIVGTLCNLDGMTSKDIGIIEIRDISAFVEILNGKGEDALEKLQTTPIKGRIRRVSKVEE